MPPSRRRPSAQPPLPARRPKVAGLRRPTAAKPVDTPTDPRDQGSAEHPDSTEETAGTAVSGRNAIGDKVAGRAEPAAPAARPSPRRKTRDTGTHKPADTDDADVGVAGRSARRPAPAGGRRFSDADTAGTGRARRQVGYPLVAGLLVLALVLSGAAVFFKIRHSAAAAAMNNTALVDVATTAEVKEAMSSAAERLFSVDYHNLDKTQQAADELLVGKDVKNTYDALMGQLREIAPKQKLVVTVTATRSAVVLLDDNRAKVMVYVDQTATRTENNQTSTGASAMWFETERRDGEWKVVDMDTYAAAETMPQSTPSSQVEEPTKKPTEGN